MTASDIEALRTRIAEEQQRRAVLDDRKTQAQTSLAADLSELQRLMGADQPVTVEDALVRAEALEAEAQQLETLALATLEGTQ